MPSGVKNSVMMAYLANAFKAISLATEEGDMTRGVLTVGQATGLLHDIPAVADLFERMINEAREAEKGSPLFFNSLVRLSPAGLVFFPLRSASLSRRWPR